MEWLRFQAYCLKEVGGGNLELKEIVSRLSGWKWRAEQSHRVLGMRHLLGVKCEMTILFLNTGRLDVC